MDCRVNLMKKKSVRLVLVGMCGAAGLLVTPAMRDESGLSVSAVTMSANEAETGHPLEGFWKKTWIRKKGDSHKGSQPFVHYKYYGEDHMVSLSVWYVGINDVDVDFEGGYTSFEYMSKKAIREGGGKLKIKTRSEDMFELSWTGRSPVGETDYEEGWERYPMPSGLAAIHQGMCDAHEVDGRYTGMWEVQGLRQPLTGELIPSKLKSYKWYGDGYFLGFTPNRTGEDRVYFKGHAGTFTSEGDSIIKERGGRNKVKWLSDDTFEMSWFNGRGVATEVWKRVENDDLEQQVLRVMKPMFLRVEGLSVADMYAADKVYEKADVPPQYPGGINALMEYMSSNIHYPEACVKEKVEGRVMVSFVVDKDGNVTRPQVVKSPDVRLSAEAVRVIMAMTKWKPARLDGKPVSMKVTAPIMFALKGKKK